jgi:hypothetical protein
MRTTLLSLASLALCMLAAAATNAAEPGETTIGGRGFLDLTYIDEETDGLTTDASGAGIDVKRFYFVLGHQFDKTWSANLTTDFNYVANDAETQLFVKKAYFEGKFSDAFTLRVGSADVPLVPFVEGLYGYRYVETMLVERIGFEASADWGVHALGAFGNKKAHYAVSAISGAGYKTLQRSQTMDVDARVDFEPVDGLTLALFYRTGKRGLDKQSVSPLHTAERSELLAAYVRPKFRVGAEYFQADNWNQVLAVPEDEADGYSVWGSVGVSSKKNVTIFARYDDAKPSKDLNSNLDNTYFNVGVSFQPISKLDIAFLFKRDKVENGVLKTSNGTIGGIAEGAHDEIGVWAQVSF